MDHLRWSYRPTLSGPVVIAAFEGWNDAGEAASAAVRWFDDRWSGHPFAELDPEEFYDFTATRPRVRFDDDGERVIDWPTNTFSAATLPTTDKDAILLRGVEPQLKWRTFCAAVTEVATALDASMVITLGALLAEVPHSRPVQVVGTAYDDEVVAKLGLRPSQYEGPTGIVGVLHRACHDAGITSASLWATIPTYVPGSPSPKATLALVRRAARLLDEPVVTTDLEIAASAYERQINEVVADDDDTRDYVAALERQHDEEYESESADLVQEVERFLRGLGD